MSVYSLTSHTIKVTSPYKLEVINRDTQVVQETIDLSLGNAQVYVDNDNMYVVGTQDGGDNTVNAVDPGNNDVYLSEDGIIENINGDEIDATMNYAYMQKDSDDIEFSETSI